MKPLSVTGAHLNSNIKKSHLIPSNLGPDEGPKRKKKMSADLEFKLEENVEKMRSRSDDVNQVGAVMPDEVLEVIFENLKQPKDLSSVAQACHRFRNVIIKQKQWRHAQALPHILPYLPKQDILNLRLVSPLWNQRVDSTIQNHCRPQPWNSSNLDLFEYIKAKSFLPMRLTLTSTLTSKHSDLDELPRDPTRNPFVTRWISLGYTGSFAEDYWCHAILFLKQFGHFIWHLNLKMSPFFSDSQQNTDSPQYYQIYEILLEILNLTPNLKSLELQFGQVLVKRDIHPDNQFCLHFLQKNPIPVQVVTKLKSLYLTGSSRYVPIQTSVLTQLSGQLQKIEIGGKLELSLKTLFGGSGGGGGEEGLSLDNLKDLSLKVTDPKLANKVLGKLKAPSLRKLGLDMEVSGNPIILETFNILKRFPSLECLWWHVEVKGVGEGYLANDSGISMEPLVSLTYLQICHFEGLPYNKLFQCMPALEEVTIFGRKKERSREPRDVMELAKLDHLWTKVDGKKLERFVVKEFVGATEILLSVDKVIVERIYGDD